MTNIIPDITTITAVLPVNDVEASAVFFEKIGFHRTNEVSEDPTDPTTPLGFVIMENGKSQIMFQSIVSIRNDDENMLPNGDTTAMMFLEVSDLDSVIKALDGHAVFMERRETFYGSKEIGIEGPGEHKFTFAQFNRDTA
ncbi:VOC family protein [Kordiimonas aquimaris]|uniref:VOC family protein n=1 Tax=Kordiimonas aquimaris TaxID=707591 RepID=UPI0021CEDC40|nr:VOC family protein [Kordiimonas aquimaris]